MLAAAVASAVGLLLVLIGMRVASTHAPLGVLLAVTGYLLLVACGRTETAAIHRSGVIRRQRRR